MKELLEYVGMASAFVIALTLLDRATRANVQGVGAVDRTTAQAIYSPNAIGENTMLFVKNGAFSPTTQQSRGGGL